MPRVKSGPTVPWPSLESCTPLGTLLVEWMWNERPPMPVALLASRVGVDRSTLVSWLTTERQPQPLQLLALAQVTDLALTELTRAANVPLERALRQRDALWDYLEWEIRRSHGREAGDMPPVGDLQAFLERLSAERVLASGVLQREEERDERAARLSEAEEA